MLKLFAIVTMFADHLGFVLGFVPLQIIGRACMPVVVLLCVRGCVRTTSLSAYFGRLVFFGSLAQLPHIWLFHSESFFPLNFIFTLSLVVGFYWLYFDLTRSNKFYRCALFVGLLAVVFCDVLVNLFEYPLFLIFALGILFYYIQDFLKLSFAYVVLISLSILVLPLHYLFALAAIPALALPDTKVMSSKFFYWFYPVHLYFLILLIHTHIYIYIHT